jgi:hypothetical protein
MDTGKGCVTPDAVYILQIKQRDEEIARLRKRLAEWVERLRWADGLTDVVEQMREEAEV